MDQFLNPVNNQQRLLNEYNKFGSLIVAFDFDNTVYDYHGLGYKFDNVIELLKECKKLGFYLIVFTCNGEEKYDKIRKVLNEKEIPFDAINTNAPYIDFAKEKIYYNILLDDRAGLESAYRDLKFVINEINIKENDMVAKKSWKEFKDSGLLWWINTLLHTFGWAIAIETDKDGSVTNVYPARVKYRGFSEKNNTKGYIKVSEYLNKNSQELLKESQN